MEDENEIYFDNNKSIIEAKFLFELDNLSPEKAVFINDFIAEESLNLSNKVNKSINQYLDGNLNIKKLTYRFLFRKRNNYCIPNINKVEYLEELEIFFENVFELSNQVFRCTKTEELIILKENIKSFKFNKLVEKNQSLILQDNYSLFKQIQELIENETLFSNDKFHFYKNTLNIYNLKYYNSNSLAEKIGLSTERIRQNRIKLLNEITNKIKLFKVCNISIIIEKYFKDVNEFIIDDKLVNSLNVEEKIDFSKEFIFLLFSILLEDEYFLKSSSIKELKKNLLRGGSKLESLIFEKK